MTKSWWRTAAFGTIALILVASGVAPAPAQFPEPDPKFTLGVRF